MNDLDDPLQAVEPFTLVGLLANYDKFEASSQYQVRTKNCRDRNSIESIISTVGSTSAALRDKYVAIQDDLPVAWSVGGTLSYIGLGTLAGAKPAAPTLTEEEIRVLFAEQ